MFVCSVSHFGALQSLRIQLKCPRNHKRNWKTDYAEQYNQPHNPIRDLEKWKDLCCHLNEHPGHNTVGNRDFVNVATLYLGEEVRKIHFPLLVGSDLLRT